jgi:hypothetical protein
MLVSNSRLVTSTGIPVKFYKYNIEHRRYHIVYRNLYCTLCDLNLEMMNRRRLRGRLEKDTENKYISRRQVLPIPQKDTGKRTLSPAKVLLLTDGIANALVFFRVYPD